MSIERETLGSAIKQVRVARGLTQIQLADVAGLSKGGNSIALIEQGKRFVSVDTLNALAKALDIPPACLAILGSRNVGENKAATDFMKSLQNLISTVVLAEAELRSDEKSEKDRRAAIGAERRSLSEIATVLRGVTKRRRPKAHKSSRTRATKTSRTRAKEASERISY